MVHDEANKAARTLLWFVPMDADDLAGYGFIGLLRGLKDLDETRSEGEQFVFMRWRVHSAIHHAIYMNNPNRHKNAAAVRVDDPEGLILEKVAAEPLDVDAPIEVELVKKRLTGLTPIREYAMRRCLDGATNSEIASEIGRTKRTAWLAVKEAREAIAGG